MEPSTRERAAYFALRKVSLFLLPFLAANAIRDVLRIPNCD